MKKALSIALALVMVFCLSAAAFAAGTHTVTIINGMDDSVYATYTVADGEDFVFTISCSPPADMGPVADGEAGSGVVTTIGSIAYSNITLGGPNQYPTAETVTISGITADATVTVTPNPAEVDSQFPAITEGAAAAGGSGEASSGEPSGEAVVPGTYTDGELTLVIADDMTFSMDKTGQNMEGEEFVLTVTGTVTADGVFTVTGLFDGEIDLSELATEEQKAADLATVEAVYAAATASGEPSGEPSGEASGEALSVEDAFIEYIHEWLIAEDEINDTMTEEVRENEFMPLVRQMDFDTYPADMIYNGMLEQGVPMTFEEFAAQYAG